MTLYETLAYLGAAAALIAALGWIIGGIVSRKLIKKMDV
jgi:hypothetical protein